MIGYFQKAQYITTITDSLRAARVNLIQFRFRTNLPSGLLLYHGGKTEYVLIELVDGNLELKMSLENGEFFCVHVLLNFSGASLYASGTSLGMRMNAYCKKVIST